MLYLSSLLPVFLTFVVPADFIQCKLCSIKKPLDVSVEIQQFCRLTSRECVLTFPGHLFPSLSTLRRSAPSGLNTAYCDAQNYTTAPTSQAGPLRREL